MVRPCSFLAATIAVSHSGEATKLHQERNRLLIALITLNNLKRNDSYTTTLLTGEMPVLHLVWL